MSSNELTASRYCKEDGCGNVPATVANMIFQPQTVKTLSRQESNTFQFPNATGASAHYRFHGLDRSVHPLVPGNSRNFGSVDHSVKHSGYLRRLASECFCFASGSSGHLPAPDVWTISSWYHLVDGPHGQITGNESDSRWRISLFMHVDDSARRRPTVRLHMLA